MTRDQLPSATPLELATAINQCIDSNVRVINLSLAVAQASSQGEQPLEEALSRTVSHNVIVVAAAGNQGTAIVTQAANLNIRYWLTFDGQRFNAVDTITHPIPTGGAPMEVTIHVSVDLWLDLKETTLRRTGGLVCASGL